MKDPIIEWEPGWAPEGTKEAAPASGSRGEAAAFPRLVRLRELESAEDAAALLPLGDPRLDAMTGGGLPRGAVTECVAPRPGDGGHSFLRAVLAAGRRSRGFCAFVDGEDSLDPASLPETVRAGLLWVRCSGAHQAMRAVDLLVRDANFPIVALDLPRADVKGLRRIAATSWYRLQRVVAQQDAWLAVCAPRPLVAGARLRLEVRAQRDLGCLDTPEADWPAGLEFNVRRSRSAGAWERVAG